MRLKRGLERASCDFCYRRKISCNLSSRTRAGHGTCPQCDLRQKPCVFESDDLRTQRRHRVRRGSSTSTPGSSVAQRDVSREIVTGQGTSEIENVQLILNETDTLFSASSSTSIATSQSPSDPALAQYSQEQAGNSTSFDFNSFDFELSSESNSFLNSVFQRDDMIHDPPVHSSVIPTSATQPNYDQINDPTNDRADSLDPYGIQELESNLLREAIESYFSFCYLAFPLLLKDAFMADYESRRASPALVFALACHGSSFLQTEERWALRQQFASSFRDAFLQARSATETRDAIRLDDLEALVLMVDFDYSEAGSSNSSVHLQLEALLLTHDSLVHMVLQYKIQASFVSTNGSTWTLCNAPERQKILFWHVYGLDAFRAIDRKVVSRIQDDEVDLMDRMISHENQSYLDAILSLAIIARKIAQALCGTVAKRKGVKRQDVEMIYQQLKEWREDICPPRLRVPVSSCGEMSLRDTRERDCLSVHQAVTTFLELNCYMEIESCVINYGIQDPHSFENQILDLRVKFETLGTSHRILGVAQWMEKIKIDSGATRLSTPLSLMDFAPDLLRNMCVGAATWMCLKAEELRHQKPSTLDFWENRSTAASVNSGLTKDSVEQAISLLKSVSTLRNVAAKAKAHSDTQILVERLDLLIEPLKQALAKD
ncbi:hypothetical protein F5Y16DRAFT_47928 [Xylariaceae sp. FL0255]|nr:hypothetical protein F5Y16DRAFT_47928 [Xylariaceae sp. FL0255]